MRSWLALIVLVGCGSDKPGSEPITPGEAEGLCTKSCGYDVDCQGDDLDACITDCVDEVGTWARHDAIATVSECRDSLTCDDDTEICLERVKPLAFHRQFEEACRAGLDGCETVDLDTDCAVEYSAQGDDIGYYRFMSEPVIDELTACFGEADCDAKLACMDAVYETYGIAL